MEETERYAGSWGDPARMAANYAGVFQNGDIYNYIVIRGNSPYGLIWRMEGIPIPNPNHFDIPGATGGPVSMVNNKLLTQSDFLTGAFPAEYSDGVSGVFDLHMRDGNNQKREYVAEIGLMGLELGAEGPFSKNHLSYGIPPDFEVGSWIQRRPGDLFSTSLFYHLHIRLCSFHCLQSRPLPGGERKTCEGVRFCSIWI